MTIKPVNIENLEDILTKIWSGELEHNQETFFCGTACCLAGWDVALNHPVEYANRINWVGLARYPSKAFRDSFTWSMSNNNLNSIEAVLMFNSDATKYLHSLVLKAFKAGRRLIMSDQGFSMQDRVLESDHYDSGVVQIATRRKEDSDALIEFLGDYDDSKIQVL